MRPAGVLSGYAAGLAVVFAAAMALGSAVGPVGTAGTPAAAAHDSHEEPQAQAGAAVGGLAVSEAGYTLQLAQPVVAAGRPADFRFTIGGPDGQPLRSYRTSHDKPLHLVVVRRDLAEYRHVHPVLGSDGTWSIPLTLGRPGPYKVIADFVPPGRTSAVVLAADLTVPGVYTPESELRPAKTTAVDGYDVTMTGALVAGEDSPLTFSVSRAGQRVPDLQPYLGANGHLIVLREGDLAYLHVHPGSSAHEPLSFVADVPSPGRYRLFLEVRHDDAVHTASFAAEAGAS
jgi:hypothetical protein